MPRPTLPPTPGSSVDIKGKDGVQLGQMSFELPPPALNAVDSRSSSASTKSSSASSYRPTSPKSPAVSPTSLQVSSRRRSSAAQIIAKDAFTLPPPPTRSRKIIQMKPRQADEPSDLEREVPKGPAAKASTGPSNKKKQPSATSVAGRKIARKTAHSLIERRRRSKMNEEFGVLKSMIPACTGEMHKLAILQASIDYIHYLEDCVAKLKAQNGRQTPTPSATQDYMPLPPTARAPFNPSESFDAYNDNDDEGEGEGDEDVEMTGSEAPSPNFQILPNRSQQPSISPALLAQDSRHRQESYSSASNDHRHYSYTTSSNTSPAFGPRTYEYAISNSASNSALPSPALLPQGDLDHEATAALLMLNTDRRDPDRRGTSGGSISGRTSGRGLSVKDLITT